MIIKFTKTLLTLTKKISHKAFEISLNSFDFYEIVVPKNTSFSIKDFQDLVSAQKELGGIKAPSIVLAHESASLDAEAFKTVSKKLSNPYSTADAFVIKSMSQRILGNFYLKVTKPERPTRLFNDKNEAISWLKNYL